MTNSKREVFSDNAKTDNVYYYTEYYTVPPKGTYVR